MIHLPMPIVVGAPRSGTTLLRLMLDSHPELAIPPETGFLALSEQWTESKEVLRHDFFQAVTSYPPEAPAWQDFGIPKELFWNALLEIKPFCAAEGFRAFYRIYAARAGKPRWGEKTPLYCMHMEAIQAVLPEAHFVHLIRDGRDVALSLRPLWFSPGASMETQAAYWQRCVTTARQAGARCRRYIEVRYQDLIRDAERVLKRICDFIDLNYDPGMLNYYIRAPDRMVEHRDRMHIDGRLLVSHQVRLRQQALTGKPPQLSRIGVWKDAMSPEEQRQFEGVAGNLLLELGYEC